MDILRFILVLASMSPLFILLAIRGIGIIPFEYYFPGFMFLAIAPNAYMAFRLWQAKKLNDRKIVQIDGYSDRREQLLTFVFAMLMPLFQSGVTTEADLYAALCAFLFVIYIFGNMELYYVNFWIAVCGYRIVEIQASGPGSTSHILITSRKVIPQGLRLTPLRVTDFLLFDK